MSNIIFDFDGTMADSLPLAIDLFYAWVNREPFTQIEIEEMRNMTIKQVLHKVGIPLWRVPTMLVKERKEFGKRLSEVKIFEGISDVLKQLHERGHKLYLISSNSPQNIRKFLKTNKINQYFEVIHGNTGIFGKATALRIIIRKD